MAKFINCNDRLRDDESSYGPYEISQEELEKELDESVKSGLLVDYENGIFIKEGYGALVGFCPKNCLTLDDILKYTHNDFNRKVVGKPTFKEKLKEVASRNIIGNDLYFNYQKLVDEGYDLVIGPGCVVHGQKFDRAIYCQNYKEILENDYESNIKNSR